MENWGQPCEQKEDLDYGDRHRSVYTSYAGESQPCEEDDDKYRSLGTDFGAPMDFGAPTQLGESYHGGYTRAAVGVASAYSPLGSTGMNFGGPIETAPMLSASKGASLLGISMAQAPSFNDKFQKRLNQDDFWREEESDDVSSEGGMTMEEEEPAYTAGGIPALPSHYRRDSTFRSTLSGMQTVENIKRSLQAIRKTKKGVALNFRVNGSQIEGEFSTTTAICEFVINTYSSKVTDDCIGSDGGEQIWVEIKHLTSGFQCMQAFGTLFHDVLTTLMQWGAVKELVDPTFHSFAVMMQDTTGTVGSGKPGNDFVGASDEDLLAVVKDRIRELKGSLDLTTQRQLTEEIMFIAESHSRLVVESSGIATILASLLRKNAKEDLQLSKTVLRLVRTLLAYKCFADELKALPTKKSLPKALLEAADSTENVAWQSDLVSTLKALEKVGIKVKSKKRQTYFRIQTRVNAVKQ